VPWQPPSAHFPAPRGSPRLAQAVGQAAVANLQAPVNALRDGHCLPDLPLNVARSTLLPGHKQLLCTQSGRAAHPPKLRALSTATTVPRPKKLPMEKAEPTLPIEKALPTEPGGQPAVVAHAPPRAV